MMIRPATQNDIPALVTLWVEFMDFHTTLDPTFIRSRDATTNWAQYIASKLEDKTHRILVAADGQALAGYVVAIVQEYPPIRTVQQFGFIQEIAVANQFRRRGIARQLVESAEQWLLSLGVPQTEVKIDALNEASQALFRSEGFSRHTETWIKKYNDPRPQPVEAAALTRAGMSRSSKTILGILTFWPPVYILLFFLFVFSTAFFAGAPSSAGNDPSQSIPLAFGSLFVLHFLTMLEMVGLTIFYAMNIYQEKALQGDRKTLWMVIVLLGGFMGQAAYYVLWIVKRSRVVSR